MVCESFAGIFFNSKNVIRRDADPEKDFAMRRTYGSGVDFRNPQFLELKGRDQTRLNILPDRDNARIYIRDTRGNCKRILLPNPELP